MPRRSHESTFEFVDERGGTGRYKLRAGGSESDHIDSRFHHRLIMPNPYLPSTHAAHTSVGSDEDLQVGQSSNGLGHRVSS